MHALRLIGLAALALGLCACADRDLRGSSAHSSDGGTYLVIADDNGGDCGPMLVDGKQWPHRIDEAGRIAPGAHVIECGAGIAFEIKAGTTYTFDYWGP